MRKILKNCLSILIVVAVVFSSAFAGLNEVGLNNTFSLEVKAADESKKAFDEAMYVVQGDVTCDGRITYIVYLKAGLKTSGAIVNVEFDDNALAVYEGGAYTIVDDFGDDVPAVPGMYECGFLLNSTNVCSVGYVNTSPSRLSSDTPFLSMTFYVKKDCDFADVKFTCVEFFCENEELNVTKADDPIVMFEDEVNITLSEHISGDWIERLPTVYAEGYRYRECIVCEQVIESVVLPQLLCDEPGLTGVFQDPIGLIFIWNSVNGADSYAVYRKTETTEWVLIGEVEYNTTTYLDTDVEAGVVYYYTVKAINEAGASSHNIDGVSGEFHVHKFSDWETTTNATCTTSGVKERVCYCGEEEIMIIGALGHNYSDEWVVDVEPTCTKEGSKSHHCTVCGNKVDVTSIPALDHNYSDEWTIDIAPTCNQEGSKSHHCIVCGDKTDITTIMTTDHNYEVKSTGEAHPHQTVYQCSYCEATKTENTTVYDCLECNFIITYAPETDSYDLMSYIGSSTEVVIPGEYNGSSVAVIGRSCFKDRITLESVKISDGVKAIDALAFMNCSSLERIYIPSSVTSIDDKAFYDASDNLTIYCYRGSTAREYAIENNIDYVLMNIAETDDVRVDFENGLIYSSIQGSNDLTEFWIVSDTAEIIAVPSLVHGNTERYGTGTELTVFDNGKYIGDFTLVIQGDLTGDSVCDVIDASVAYLFSTGACEPDEYMLYAACGEFADEFDANAYQNVINVMLAE